MKQMIYWLLPMSFMYIYVLININSKNKNDRAIQVKRSANSAKPQTFTVALQIYLFSTWMSGI